MISRIRTCSLYIKEYGLKCFLAINLSKLFSFTDNDPQWKRNILQYKHKVILDYLCNYLSLEKEEHSSVRVNDKDEYKNCIWTAWLQGEEDAPEVIKLNFASIREKSSGHSVIVITNKNVSCFISVPESIKQKHESGIIGHAHYSDMIRMMILAQYGGIWLDATIFLHAPIDEKAFSSSFYSVGFLSGKGLYVSEHKWLVRVIGGNNNSAILNTISSMLNSYWIEHSVPIDYFVFDYLIAVLYRENHEFHLIIDSLPKIKFFTDELRKNINDQYSENVLNRLFQGNQIYTLSYKYDYQKQTPDGKISNYGYLVNKILENGTEENNDSV